MLLAGAALCLLAGFLEKPQWKSPEARSLQTLPAPAASPAVQTQVSLKTPPRRLVYPYSVIPGGVQNRSELLWEVAQDPIVAAHFSDFNGAGARLVQLQAPQQVHLSYRLDDRVYWTAKKVGLAPGEMLITDGREFARARCGNRISLTPQEPVSSEEPVPDAFEEPLEETIPALEPSLLLAEVHPPPVVPPDPNIPGVPEPGTLILLASGLAVLVAFKIASRR